MKDFLSALRQSRLVDLSDAALLCAFVCGVLTMAVYGETLSPWLGLAVRR
jgi:hypothetical protein